MNQKDAAKMFVYESLVHIVPTMPLPSYEFKSDEAFTDFLALDSRPFIQDYGHIQFLLGEHWANRKDNIAQQNAMLEIETILNGLGDIHPYFLIYADHIASMIASHYQGGKAKKKLNIIKHSLLLQQILLN